ncbi:MAG: AMP-binding protein [Pseudoclavibacter sp.]|nr:AMP-binding protein [Pseudoclavibacter sp.]
MSPRRRAATAAERELWLAARLHEDPVAFTTAHAFTVPGRIDRAAMSAAWAGLLRAAPHLTARFESGAAGEAERLELVFQPEAAPPLELLRADGAADGPGLLARLRSTPFDPARGPLCRAALVEDPAAEETSLVVAVSHLAVDGYAWSLLLGELERGYAAARAGERPPDGALRQPDPDPAEEPEHAAWWRGHLAGLPHPSRRPLPLRQARPRATRAMPGTGRLELAPLALAAAALAAEAPGGRRVVVDMPFLARSGEELRQPVTAMNVVPLAVDPGAAPDAAGLLEQCAATLAEVRPRAAARAESARREHGRTGAPPPVADIALNLVPFPHELRLDGRAARVTTLASGPGDVDAIAVRAQADGGARLEADAREREDPGPRSAALAERFARAVEALVRGEMPEPRPAARDAAQAAARPVLERIRERVRQAPRAPAFLEPDGARTGYGELWAAAEALAARLRGIGVGAERPVGVCAPRGARHAIGVLGTLLAGGAFVPLPAEAGEAAERRRICGAVAPEAVVLGLPPDAEVPAGLPAGAPLLRTPEPAGAAAPPGRLPAAHPAQLAYVITTSGSSGVPKPVAVSRGALDAWTGAVLSDYLRLRPGERMAQFAAVHFDASVEELFCALCAGAALVPRSGLALERIGDWLEECGRLGVSVLDLPTGYWHELVVALAAGTARLPACVRTVVIGGEAASPERLRQWRQAVGERVRLVNSYGPTEATVVATRALL